MMIDRKKVHEFALDRFKRERELEDSIVLRCTQSGWTAENRGPSAKLVYDLFRTTELPTPFGASVPAAVVVAAIEQRNPGVLVRVAAAGEPTDIA